MTTEAWSWDAFYRLSDSNEVEDALDLIFNACCSMDLHPDYTVIDRILAGVDVERLSEDLLVGFLGAAYSISQRLPAYRPLLDRSRGRLVRLGLDPKVVASLLQGFADPPGGRARSV